MTMRLTATLLGLVTLGCMAPTSGPLDSEDKAAVQDFARDGERFVPTPETGEQVLAIPEVIEVETIVEPVYEYREEWNAYAPVSITMVTPNLVIQPDQSRIVKVSNDSHLAAQDVWSGFVLRVRNRNDADAEWEEIIPPATDVLINTLDRSKVSYWTSVAIIPHAGIVTGQANYAGTFMDFSGGWQWQRPDPVIATFAGAPPEDLEFQVLAMPFFEVGQFDRTGAELESGPLQYVSTLTVEYVSEECGVAYGSPCAVRLPGLDQQNYCSPELMMLGRQEGLGDTVTHGVELGAGCYVLCSASGECGESEVCTPVNDAGICRRPGQVREEAVCSDVERGVGHPELCAPGLECVTPEWRRNTFQPTELDGTEVVIKRCYAR